MTVINAKKHAVRQIQNNDWHVTLTVSNEDFHEWGLARDDMGTIYSIDVVNMEEEAFKAVYTNPTDNPVVSKTESTEKSDGEKLRIRACCLCKVGAFEDWIIELDTPGFSKYSGLVEEFCRDAICNYCDIKSRSELTTDIAAQEKFKELLGAFDKWKVGKKYSDNLERV